MGRGQNVGFGISPRISRTPEAPWANPTFSPHQAELVQHLELHVLFSGRESFLAKSCGVLLSLSCFSKCNSISWQDGICWRWFPTFRSGWDSGVEPKVRKSHKKNSCFTKLGVNPGILRKTSRFSCSFPATFVHFHRIGKSKTSSRSFKASGGQENEHSLCFPAPDSSQKVGKSNFLVWNDPFTLPTFLASSQSCFLGIPLLFLVLIFHVCASGKGKNLNKSDPGINPERAEVSFK